MLSASSKANPQCVSSISVFTPVCSNRSALEVQGLSVRPVEGPTSNPQELPLLMGELGQRGLPLHPRPHGLYLGPALRGDRAPERRRCIEGRLLDPDRATPEHPLEERDPPEVGHPTDGGSELAAEVDEHVV